MSNLEPTPLSCVCGAKTEAVWHPIMHSAPSWYVTCPTNHCRHAGDWYWLPWQYTKKDAINVWNARITALKHEETV